MANNKKSITIPPPSLHIPPSHVAGNLPVFPQDHLMRFLSTINASPHIRHLPPLTSLEQPSSNNRLRPPSALLRSELQRKRRRNFGDRVRALEALMPPWSAAAGRVDAGTVLAEARKYVEYLEAQVTALQSMPRDAGGFAVAVGGRGGLEGLNRQQLLQVAVTSPVVQGVMCRRGTCVVSAEQVETLRREMMQRPEMVMLLRPSGGGGR